VTRDDTRARARLLLQQHGLPSGRLEALHGWSNDVWLTPTHVVRLSSGRFRHSFRHEVAVTRVIADRVNVPEIIAHGEEDGREWMISVRVPGRSLLDVWPELDEAERRRAVHELGGNLRRLHDMEFAEEPENPWQADAVSVRGKARDAYHVLPKYYPVLVDSLRAARLVEERLLKRVEAFLSSRMHLFDAERVLVHGDAHFNNLVWDGAHITLIDFEGAAMAPPDMELDTLIRFTRNPAQFYGGDARVLVQPADVANVLAELKQSYPALFASPDLVERLGVYEMMWQLLQLHHFPPGHMLDPRPRVAAVLQGEWTRGLTIL
jgi:aminoglycoside phosphotransferase (APT) family kinase protein